MSVLKRSGCPICSDAEEHQQRYMCASCSKSYERDAFDCGDVMTALVWAAQRARKFEARRQRPSRGERDLLAHLRDFMNNELGVVEDRSTIRFLRRVREFAVRRIDGVRG